MEKWLESEYSFEGKIINVRTGVVRLDDGTETYREIVEHGGAVAMIPILGDRVILVRQFRLAVGRDVLEIPAGKIEEDEDPLSACTRELEEETGYVSSRIVPIGAFYPSVGFLTEKIHLYLAFDLEKTRQKPDVDERIDLVEMAVKEIRDRLKDRKFEDAKTIIGLHAYLGYIDENG